jgi:hypothetical protein
VFPQSSEILSLITMLFLLFFLTLSFYNPLRLFLSKDLTIKYLIPISVSSTILFLWPFYVLSILVIGQKFFILAIILVNIFTFRSRNFWELINSKPNIFDLIVLGAIIKSQFTFNLKNYFLVHSDLINHTLFLIQLKNSGITFIDSLGFYPPGWYIFNSMFINFVSDQFILRFLGPSLGVYLLLAVYLVFKYTNKYLSILLIMILLFPIPGSIAKFFFFPWPTQLTMMLVVFILDTFRNYFKQDTKFLFLFPIFIITLFLTNYYYGYLFIIYSCLSLLLLISWKKAFLTKFNLTIMITFFFSCSITLINWALKAKNSLEEISLSATNIAIQPSSQQNGNIYLDSELDQGTQKLAQEQDFGTLLLDLFFFSRNIPQSVIFTLLIILIIFLVRYKLSHTNILYIFFLLFIFCLTLLANLSGIFEVDSYLGRGIFFAVFALVLILSFIKINPIFTHVLTVIFITIVFIFPPQVKFSPVDEFYHSYLLNQSKLNFDKIDCNQSLVPTKYILSPDLMFIIFPKFCSKSSD